MTRVERGGKMSNVYPRGDRRGFDNSFMKKAAFTLPEILITIGVIGVVAAMTIPNMITNIQDKQFRVAWKKTFASVANAYRMAQENPIDIPMVEGWEPWYPGDREVFSTYYKIFANLKTLDYCAGGINTPVDCIHNSANFSKRTKYDFSKIKSLNGDKKSPVMYNATGGFAILQDGVHLFGHAAFWHYPDIMVDVNGPSKPNVVGRDIFVILIRKGQVIAAGVPGYEMKGCSMNTSSDSGYRSVESFSGSGCGYKYLHEK